MALEILVPYDAAQTYRPVRQDAQDGQKANMAEARPQNLANSTRRCTETRMISLRGTYATAFPDVRVVGTDPQCRRRLPGWRKARKAAPRVTATSF